MAYPDIRPSSRQFDPGNWPVRTYNAQNGAEVRLLYGKQAVQPEAAAERTRTSLTPMQSHS